MLGSSKYEVLSVLDLKDVFLSLKTFRKVKEILWNTPYFWQHVLSISENAHGINFSPSIWQSYINVILDCLQSKKYCKAIMDDLLLFTPSKRSHMDKLEDLLKALLKNGLKISPKKCQLFRANLQYMGKEIFIQDKRVCVKPLRNRLEAIQIMQPPLRQKDADILQGWVNFLSMFCP